jgi:aconitate hydratase
MTNWLRLQARFPGQAACFPNIKRLPVSIRIVLESVLRNCDGKKVTRST